MAENSKTGAGRLKPEPHLISPIAMLWINAAMESGAIKYGAMPPSRLICTSRRSSGTSTSTRRGRRGIGQQASHLAHIAVGCIFLMDAEVAGTLIGDPFKIKVYKEVLLQVQVIKARWVAARAARSHVN